MTTTATRQPSAAERHLAENEARLTAEIRAIAAAAHAEAQAMTKAEILQWLRDNDERTSARESDTKDHLVGLYEDRAVKTSPQQTALTAAQSAVRDERAAEIKMRAIVEQEARLAAAITDGDPAPYQIADRIRRLGADLLGSSERAAYARTYLSEIDHGADPREAAASTARECIAVIRRAPFHARTNWSVSVHSAAKASKAGAANDVLKVVTHLLPAEVQAVIGFW